MSEDAPAAAAIVGAVGGVFVLFGGLFFGSLGSALNSAGYYAGGNLLGLIGVYGDIIGLVIVLVSIRLYTDPEHHVGYGIGLLLLGFLSFPAGAGFILGLILCIIGGILGIIWEGDDDSFDYAWRASEFDAHASPDGATARRSSPWPFSAPVAATPTPPKGPLPSSDSPPAAPSTTPASSAKTCPSCGTVFERSRQYCPQCGALAP